MRKLLKIKNLKLTKLYYQIGEVAAMFSLSTSTLRYWESEFSNIRPKKNRRGERSYQTKDIFEIEKVYILVKERGFTIEGAKKELATSKKRPDHETNVLVTDKLKQLKKRLKTLLTKLS